MNGNSATLSADAFGIAVCLFAYSNLSFGDGWPVDPDGLGEFEQVCAQQYHLLFEYAIEHPMATGILKIID
jgi:hypothetical protein